MSNVTEWAVGHLSGVIGLVTSKHSRQDPTALEKSHLSRLSSFCTASEVCFGSHFINYTILSVILLHTYRSLHTPFTSSNLIPLSAHWHTDILCNFLDHMTLHDFGKSIFISSLKISKSSEQHVTCEIQDVAEKKKHYQIHEKHVLFAHAFCVRWRYKFYYE